MSEARRRAAVRLSRARGAFHAARPPVKRTDSESEAAHRGCPGQRSRFPEHVDYICEFRKVSV